MYCLMELWELKVVGIGFLIRDLFTHISIWVYDYLLKYLIRDGGFELDRSFFFQIYIMACFMVICRSGLVLKSCRDPVFSRDLNGKGNSFKVYYGKGGSPSSCRKILCLELASWIFFSASATSLWVSERSTCSSSLAVLT